MAGTKKPKKKHDQVVIKNASGTLSAVAHPHDSLTKKPHVEVRIGEFSGLCVIFHHLDSEAIARFVISLFQSMEGSSTQLVLTESDLSGRGGILHSLVSLFLYSANEDWEAARAQATKLGFKTGTCTFPVECDKVLS